MSDNKVELLMGSNFSCNVSCVRIHSCKRFCKKRCRLFRTRGDSDDENEEMPSLEPVTDDNQSILMHVEHSSSGSDVVATESPRKRRAGQSARSERLGGEELMMERGNVKKPDWYLVYDSEHGVMPVSKLFAKGVKR
jgi:hypothetical protein